MEKESSPVKKYFSCTRNEELTGQESIVYDVLRRNGPNLISAEEISEIIEKMSLGSYKKNTIQVMIGRIKMKLGDEEIINVCGLGYVSRREIIKEMVKLNLESPFEQKFTFNDVMRGIKADIAMRRNKKI